MQFKSENENSPYFSNSIIKKLHEQIKPEIINTEVYRKLLTDLILKGESGDFPAIKFAVIANGNSENLVLETLAGQLYYSVKSIKKTINQSINEFKSSAEILAWGYEIRLKNQKSVIVNCNISKLNPEKLIAVWTAIKLSNLESIQGLEYFCSQSPEAWELSCKNIADSHLTSFHFSGINYLSDVTAPMWKLFWDTMQSSKIQHLDMRFVQLSQEQLSTGFWNTLCNGIRGSKIKSISFERMSLDKLNYEQWRTLYDALCSVEIQFINLTCNHLCSSNFETEEQVRINSLIGNIISIPSLKQLIWLEDHFEFLDSNLWLSFCEQLENSQLEHLEICVCWDKSLTHDSWINFIDSLKKMKLKTLVIKHHSSDELSSPIIKALSDMISESSLESFSCIHYFKPLSLTPENWQVLARAFKKKSIKTFNWGSIDSSMTNLDGFSNFILNTDINSLNLSSHYLNNLFAESWIKLSDLVKKSHVSTLDITKNYLVASDLKNWEIFCDMIENSSIRTLHLDTVDFNNLKLDYIKLFCKAIRLGNVETLVLDIHHNFWYMKAEYLMMIFDAINRSKITKLDINDFIDDLPPSKKEIVLNTLRIVENKANYKNTLFGSCIYTLFGQCNAKVTDAGISFNYGGNLFEEELDSEFKDGLKKFS